MNLASPSIFGYLIFPFAAFGSIEAFSEPLSTVVCESDQKVSMRTRESPDYFEVPVLQFIAKYTGQTLTEVVLLDKLRGNEWKDVRTGKRDNSPRRFMINILDTQGFGGFLGVIGDTQLLENGPSQKVSFMFDDKYSVYRLRIEGSCQMTTGE